jgi:hypothetical protein
MMQTVNQCFACELIGVGKWQNSFEFMCFECMDQYELTIVKDVYPQPEEMCRPQLQNGMALRLATTSRLRESAATTSSVRLHLMKTE